LSALAYKYKIFDTLLDGVLIINADGKIRYCNHALSNILNIPIKRIKYDTDISAYVAFVPELFKVSQPGLKAMTEATPYRELTIQSKGGKSCQVQISIQPEVSDKNEESLWLLFIRDVTLEASLHTKYLGELENKERVIEKLQEAQQKLKEYSETLEKKVEQRTADLTDINQKLTSMVNSLGQAFVIVNKEGFCSKTYSKVTLKLFEIDPSDKPLSTVLKIPREQKSSFQNWFNFLLQERIPFSEFVPFGPKIFPHSRNKHVALEFYPIREDKSLIGVVVVGTDKTNEIAALKLSEQEQINAKRILKLAKYKDLFWPFIEGVTQGLSELHTYLGDPENFESNMDEIHRLAHTLKGAANLFWISPLIDDVHNFETLINEMKNPSQEQRMKIARKAKAILTRAEVNLKEFLIENEPIVGAQKNKTQKYVDLPYDKLQLFYSKLGSQKTLAEEFENEFLKEPIGRYFTQFDDLLASIASKSRKLLYPIKMKNDETRIFVDDYSEFLDCLVHLMTNALEHGIESPEIRARRNKDVKGTITVEVLEEGGALHFNIEDDGNGIDPNKIREKMASLGMGHGKGETDLQVIQHIFDPGFSTSSSITTISGRGIGLNAL